MPLEPLVTAIPERSEIKAIEYQPETGCVIIELVVYVPDGMLSNLVKTNIRLLFTHVQDYSESIFGHIDPLIEFETYIGLDEYLFDNSIVKYFLKQIAENSSSAPTNPLFWLNAHN
jgi:hypothetical protein